MATTFGLTPSGFVPMRQSDIISAVSAALQAGLGQNINLLPEAVFGQLVNIFSAREATLWELGEALYSNTYPSGAEGTAVDNLLALNNLKRLPASPTVTASEENDVFGLVLYGTPGTIISAGSIISVFGTPTLQFTLDDTVTIQPPVNAIQNLAFRNIPTTGAFSLSIVDSAGNTISFPSSVQWSSFGLSNTSLLVFSSTPASSTHFGLSLTVAGVTLTTGNISTAGAYPTQAAIQSAITALSGYSGVTVTGSAGEYEIVWGTGIPNPILTVANNTTTVTITPADSVQANINNMYDSVVGNYPYTDVSYDYGTGLISFGANTPAAGQPSSGNQFQNLFSAPPNTLQDGSTVTNILITAVAFGAQALANGSATCTVNGPNFVAANTLNVIGSPVSGWTSVTNPLDCLTGSNIESDTAAMTRRALLLNSNANGPLQAIVGKVSLLQGVISTNGYQNLTQADNQVIYFLADPSSGSFSLSIDGQTTTSLNYNAAASDVQSALNALSGYNTVTVSGSVTAGFNIAFNGANGGIQQQLIQIVSSTLDNPASVRYGLPGKAFEIIADGGSNASIAQTIYASKPAGIQPYGTPIVVTGDTTATSTTISVISDTANILVGQRLDSPLFPVGTVVTAVNIGASSVTVSNPATSGVNGALLYFTNTATVTDDLGNSYVIDFSRPVFVPIYVVINLTTDLKTSPNPKFQLGFIPQIQEDIVNIINAVPIGGLIVGFGSGGLFGAFNNVPGIVSYTMYFGVTYPPSLNVNIQISPEQIAQGESFNVVVSYV